MESVRPESTGKTKNKRNTTQNISDLETNRTGPLSVSGQSQLGQTSTNQLPFDPEDPINTLKFFFGQDNPAAQKGMSGLFQTEKETVQDLHVIRDWTDERLLRYITRVMNPYQLTFVMTMIEEIKNFDEKSGRLCESFVKNYLINMIAYKGQRVLEQIEGLRARKQNEESGLDLGSTKNLKNFLLGQNSSV